MTLLTFQSFKNVQIIRIQLVSLIKNMQPAVGWPTCALIHAEENSSTVLILHPTEADSRTADPRKPGPASSQDDWGDGGNPQTTRSQKMKPGSGNCSFSRESHQAHGSVRLSLQGAGSSEHTKNVTVSLNLHPAVLWHACFTATSC